MYSYVINVVYFYEINIILNSSAYISTSHLELLNSYNNNYYKNLRVQGGWYLYMHYCTI